MGTNLDMEGRFDIEKGFYDSIVLNGIKRTNILELNSCSNNQLMMFAAAVGALKGGMTPLGTRKDFVRGEYVKASEASQIRAIALDTLDINEITDDSRVIDILEQYANTGFIEIGKWIKELGDSKDEEALEGVLFERILDLDDLYKELFH